jgi:hypothetical protein
MKSRKLSHLASLLLAFSFSACSGDAQDPTDLFGSDDETTPGENTGSGSASLVGDFPGSGTNGAGEPLSLGAGPETARACGGDRPPTTVTPVSTSGVETICLYSESDATTPAATIEQVVEAYDGSEWVHVRLTLNPSFVDNSYGANAMGWDERGGKAPAPPAAGPAPAGPTDGRPKPADDAKPARERPEAERAAHTFRDLLGSDHAEMKLFDEAGQLVLHFKQDYVSEDSSAPSGYGSLGVTGGEGKMILGDASSILAASTSIDRDLNGCGLSTYTDSSPATDEAYTPNADAGSWDYRVVYEVWVDPGVFGDAGFGTASIEFVHASPSKTDNNTENVVPGPCPPSDDGLPEDNGVSPVPTTPEIR